MWRVHRRSPQERAQIVGVLTAALADEPTVDFAYLHGSFLDDLPFHDIDVAVMLTEEALEGDVTGAALALGDRLERIIQGGVRLVSLDADVVRSRCATRASGSAP